MGNSGLILETATIGQDVPMTLLTLSSMPDTSSQIHRKSTGGWPIFYVRTGKIPEALQTLRMVLLEDSTVARRVFTLATNATRDREAILEMLPPQAPVFFDYINFRIEKGDIAGAEEVWARVLQRNMPFELREAFPYFDALIQHKELGQLSETWSALSQRFPSEIQRLVPSSNLITNGSFEFDILNGGFDWRVMPTDGAVVGLDSVGAFEGSRALRITFDGSRNIEYSHVFQFVPVQANTRVPVFRSYACAGDHHRQRAEIAGV